MSTKILFHALFIGLVFTGTPVLACGSKFFEPEPDAENVKPIKKNLNPNPLNSNRKVPKSPSTKQKENTLKVYIQFTTSIGNPGGCITTFND